MILISLYAKEKVGEPDQYNATELWLIYFISYTFLTLRQVIFILRFDHLMFIGIYSSRLVLPFRNGCAKRPSANFLNA